MANLIAYYSRKGENYWNGGVRTISKGNTERVAEFIQEAVGGELFEIETVEDYAADYYECIDQAKKELQENARPAIKESVDIAGYDTIFLGFPIWWGVAPMCVYTFLDGLDLTGKRIVVFSTNEGSGLGGSVRDLQRRYPQANIEKKALAVHGAEAAESQSTVAAWARKMA